MRSAQLGYCEVLDQDGAPFGKEGDVKKIFYAITATWLFKKYVKPRFNREAKDSAPKP